MILEEYIFTSCFLNDIQGLIEQKKQSGYIYDSAKYILIQFDKFCVENHIDRAIITKNYRTHGCLIMQMKQNRAVQAV